MYRDSGVRQTFKGKAQKQNCTVDTWGITNQTTDIMALVRKYVHTYTHHSSHSTEQACMQGVEVGKPGDYGNFKF